MPIQSESGALVDRTKIADVDRARGLAGHRIAVEDVEAAVRLIGVRDAIQRTRGEASRLLTGAECRRKLGFEGQQR